MHKENHHFSYKSRVKYNSLRIAQGTYLRIRRIHIVLRGTAYEYVGYYFIILIEIL